MPLVFPILGLQRTPFVARSVGSVALRFKGLFGFIS